MCSQQDKAPAPIHAHVPADPAEAFCSAGELERRRARAVVGHLGRDCEQILGRQSELAVHTGDIASGRKPMKKS